MVLGLALLSIVSSGCLESEPPKTVKATGEEVTTTPAPEAVEKQVAYVDLTSLSVMKNWDADANKDGIETIIYPHSADGGDVKTDGTVIFTLYQMIMSETTFQQAPWKLQEWETKITKEEGGIMGISRRLEFDDETEEIVAMEDFFIGELHAKLITPDGKEFEATTNVM